MGFKVIPYFTNPRLHDRVVQKVRNRFDTHIGWLNYSFPIVQQGIMEDDDENEFTYPMVYANDGSTNHYDIRPDWDEGAYCFFEFLGAEPVDEEEGTLYTFDVTFYARLDKAYPSKSAYDYTSELIAEVIDHLKHVTIGARNIGWTINHEEIFEKYSDLARTYTQALMKHGTAFRITFSIHDVEDCYSELS